MVAKATLAPLKSNRTESEYGAHLNLLKLAGEIVRWDFSPVKLRLADKTFYTPDFRVIMADMTEEYHEVKGFLRDDAMVKIKVAAEQHPYRFVMVRKVRRGVFNVIWESRQGE